MIREIKLRALRFLSQTGCLSIVAGSGWRRRRLLILCYHGISIDDEHHWNGGLYMALHQFRSRLLLLQSCDCNVLPLGTALERLKDGSLPQRSVAITFDDGFFDFYSQAYPLLSEFGYPATVYWTTYYAEYNRPIFDLAHSYMLWKSEGRKLSWPAFSLTDVTLTPAARAEIDQRIRAQVERDGCDAHQKDKILQELADRLDFDYGDARRRRLLHLMTPGEASELATKGIDIQLHTHRHRVPLNKTLFDREIDDNRSRITAVSGKPAEHFCYPSGYYRSEFLPWLKTNGVISGTTCETDLATPTTDWLLLPRLLDTSSKEDAEIEAWLSGVASFLPHRRGAAASDKVE